MDQRAEVLPAQHQSAGLAAGKVDGKEMLFDLPDPDTVEVSSSGTTAVELRCGALKPFRVTVEYASPGISQPASAGVIRKMAF